MHKTFDTPAPITLYVELGAGALEVTATDTAQTTVEVQGDDPDDVTVEQRGDRVAVVAPSKKGRFLRSSSEYHVRATVPADSALVTKLGSADLVTSGRLAEGRITSGSGDVRVEEFAASATVKTASGDVAVGTAAGPLHVVTASGDTTVEEGLADVTVASASGDVHVAGFRRGTLQVKNVSGDVHLGIPPRIPVWTDVRSVSGSVASGLESRGEPAQGQDYIEIRATTVSGDIRLEQL